MFSSVFTNQFHNSQNLLYQGKKPVAQALLIESHPKGYPSLSFTSKTMVKNLQDNNQSHHVYLTIGLWEVDYVLYVEI